MKRVIAIVLVALLLLAGLIYTVGYGHDQLNQLTYSNLSNKQAQIVEMYSKKRDGPNLSSFDSEWICCGKSRLDKCQTEISLWWKKIRERVRKL